MPTYLKITSGQREEILDIGADLAALVSSRAWDTGALFLFCLHTTCALTINERADPAVRSDLKKFFRTIAPHEAAWEHMEGNTDAHIRSSLLGVSLLVPIVSGQLGVGVWQTVYLYEGDGPRERSILCQFLPARG